MQAGDGHIKTLTRMPIPVCIIDGKAANACHGLRTPALPLAEGHRAVLAPAGNSITACKGLPVCDCISLLQQVLLCTTELVGCCLRASDNTMERWIGGKSNESPAADTPPAPS